MSGNFDGTPGEETSTDWETPMQIMREITESYWREKIAGEMEKKLVSKGGDDYTRLILRTHKTLAIAIARGKA